MRATALTRFPLARDDLVDSVDTVHLVQRIGARPDANDLKRRGFCSKAGKFPNSTTWFHNAPSKIHRPHLTIYENFGAGYGFRVNTSLPKFAHGQNFDLLDESEIFDCLKNISVYVTETSGVRFDALAASVARVDFATNLDLTPENADEFLGRSRRLAVTRMPYRNDISQDRSVYHGNNSRMIRVYDKSAEMGLDEAGETRIRVEYQLPSEAAAHRFADRIRVDDHRAETLLSPGVRMVALGEVIKMLRLDSFDPAADHSFLYFFERTKNVNQARKCSSFTAAYKTLGPDFYQLSGSGMSRQRYIRELRECQGFGF